ncbi:pseudouridine synthase [Gracilimonas mengyeensis]|uniref:Pseudouridine synthase n=1 Tax=Gracilimonas mengyeensis TaxID=1302730 RepID=A0A521FKX8_9BACT|nr:pseudouridine synthase [Gracilimonas mengyeensis]SMO96779.1 23S rRNA pseudouridine2605 synthase [Gracilimonas mengyeensis]
MSKGKGGNKNYKNKADYKKPAKADQNYSQDEEIRINKFIAHAGFCSRREADTYISAGKVQVNGEVVTELGTKVRRKDTVVVDGQNLSLEPFVYLLLHKSKDVITTTDDEKDRTTVMDQIESATGHRVYPVGRLDRNTTGLLLLTNDGDLAHRLMHPSYSVRKTYQVRTDNPLSEAQLEQFLDGIELEDGPAKGYNVVQFVDDPHTFEMSVFEGRNRLIRRMVEFHGTEVTKLKRIEYAGLTLKDVPMGRWRFLRQNEVNNLRKMVKLETLDFNKGN